MPKIKQLGSVKKIKPKSLFDHINEIRIGKHVDYFKTLTDCDKKTWNSYMICRFLSMQMDLVDIINDLQYYQNKLSPEQFYKLCITAIPECKGYYPYIKNNGEKYNKQLIMLLCTYFQDSERNILEYLKILTRKDVIIILSKYGYAEKEIDILLEKC